MSATRYSVLSANVGARNEELIEAIMETAPSGGGIDTGTQLLDDSSRERLIFRMEFHHMNDVGFYDGWTSHTIAITPALDIGSREFSVEISSDENRDDIEDYLVETITHWLEEPLQ